MHYQCSIKLEQKQAKNAAKTIFLFILCLKCENSLIYKEEYTFFSVHKKNGTRGRRFYRLCHVSLILPKDENNLKHLWYGRLTASGNS